MNFKIESLLSKKETPKNLINTKTTVLVFNESTRSKVLKEIKSDITTWEFAQAKSASLSIFTTKKGPLILLSLAKEAQRALSGTDYSKARELASSLTTTLTSHKSKEVHIDFKEVNEEARKGLIVGIELSLYRFKLSNKLGTLSFKNDGKKISTKELSNASSIALAVNQARHLVNLPPNHLNPTSYAKEVKALFSKSKTISVSILDEKKLKKEKCNLLLSVGQSAKNAPCIVHLKYRPTKTSTKKSIALVGKGITFDSGGLDMKSAAGMRYMKKDISKCHIWRSSCVRINFIKLFLDT